MTDLWVPIPLDFHWALFERRISVNVYALGCYLAGESFRNQHTNDGIVSAYPADLANVFGVSAQSMRSWLRTLERDGWIGIGKVVERGHAPWTITLAALASAKPTAKQTTPTSFARALQSTSNPTAKQPDIDPHATAGPERDSAALPLQSDLQPLARTRDEKKREEKREKGSSDQGSEPGATPEPGDRPRRLDFQPMLNETVARQARRRRRRPRVGP